MNQPTTTPSSPQILHIEWGKIEIESLGTGRDYKLWPGGGRPWDWRETGTHHVPGIQPTDVEELVEHGAKVIVLTRGMHLKLQTQPATLNHLKNLGITVHVEETQAAVKRYNALALAGEPVGGLFHSTC